MPLDKSIVDAQVEALGDYGSFFTKKERKYLPEVLDENEVLKAMTSGTLDGNTWLICVTTKRVLFLDKGMVAGLKQKDLLLEHITAVSSKTGFLMGEISVATSGGSHEIKNIEKKYVPMVTSVLNDMLRNKSAAPAQAAAPAGDDVVSKLERLAKLKEQGILNDEEFAAQKAALLA